jgi:opacity protein-like surface antigen
MRKLTFTVVAMLALAFSSAALAADPTTGGTATISGGVATLTSDTSVANTPANDFGYVQLPLPSGLTLAQITELSAEFNVTDDDCGGGSPRFAIEYGANQSAFVYLGPAPTFTGCQQNTWTPTGNLVGTADQCRVDTSQLAAGTQCTTWAAALALVGSQPITSIRLVVDGGWKLADGEQTVLVRNVRLNGTAFLTPTPERKINPARFCRDQIAAMGSRAAFNELWNVSGTSNGFGKCVSAVAKARNAGATQEQILATIASCQARGVEGAALGRCVAARDDVAATRTEKQERPKKAKKAKKPKQNR